MTVEGSQDQLFAVNGSKLILTSAVDFEKTPTLKLSVSARGNDVDKQNEFETSGTFKVSGFRHRYARFRVIVTQIGPIWEFFKDQIQYIFTLVPN